MKRYYDNRRDASKGDTWDKQADLKNLFDILMTTRGFGRIQASAGTFWISWKRGIQTTHDEKNYWKCKILSRKQKDGTWKAEKGAS